MKQLLSFLFILSPFFCIAQIPSNYYDSANGLTGYALKTELHNIISNGHNPQTYGDLWTAFQTSDDDQYYESDGTVLDIYSENPNGSDPYEFTFVSEQCGNYSDEGDCYNREHLMPQSWFNEASPMKTDIHHIFPTDGYVNNVRGHLPFGEVGPADYTSSNGSKRGNNVLPGYNGTVFEPIDEFKGDVARAYFYMATRYENVVSGWENANDGSIPTFDGSSDQVFENWVVDMLLDWHENDPVSQHEIDRNDEAYDFQGNANPFIDHPEYVDMIWGSGMGIFLQEDQGFEMYPNPVSGKFLQVQFSHSGNFKIKIYNLLGEMVFEENLAGKTMELNISTLPAGVYLVEISGRRNMVKKLVRK